MQHLVPRHTTRRPARPATRIPTVCVVDPNADDYQGWDSLAQDKGVRLQFVASAEEALRFSRSTDVDLWVMNTSLPGLSGTELCSMLKARSPHAAVYLVAEHYSPQIEQAAWQSRATMFGGKGAQLNWLDQWLDHRSKGRATDAAASIPTIV